MFYLLNIGFITTNLSINQSNNSQFNEIKERINLLNNNLYELDILSIDIKNEFNKLFPDFIKKTKTFQDLFKYPIGYIHHYCNIYIDYNNQAYGCGDAFDIGAIEWCAPDEWPPFSIALDEGNKLMAWYVEPGNNVYGTATYGTNSYGN